MKNHFSKFCFVLLVAAVLLSGACKKDDDDGAVSNDISITIPSPVEGAVIAPSEPSVRIQVNVEAEQALFGVHTMLFPKGDESLLLLNQEDNQAGNPLYSFFREINMFNLSPGTEYVLRVEACGTAACADVDKLVVLRNFSIGL